MTAARGFKTPTPLSPAAYSNPTIGSISSSIPFYLYLAYLLSFFLHSGERFPAIAPLRPDLVLAMLVVLSLLPYVSTRMALLLQGTSKALLLLIGWIVLSLPFVEWPGSVVRENWQPFFKSVLFFFFTVLTVDNERRLKVFTTVFVFSQLFRVLEPVFLNITTGYMGSSTHLGGGEFAGRLSGAPSDVINPNGLGFVIATCVPFLHFLLFNSRSFFGKALYLSLMPCLLYALVQTMSRGGFIALLVAGWFILIQSKNKGGLLLLGLLVAVIGWQSMSDVQRDRYLSLVSSDAEQSATAEGRWRGMATEFRLGLESPIFGHGVGTTPEAKANVYGMSQAAHNLYAELLIEIGMIGAVLFLRFMFQVRAIIKGNLGRVAELSLVDDRLGFLRRLNQALVATFWVYAVYSINYYGLSQDYWYVLAGLTFAYSRVLSQLSMEFARSGSDASSRRSPRPRTAG